MKKIGKKKFNTSYLKLFKQSLALSFSLAVFGVGASSSYATTITPDANFSTNVSTSGNTTSISGGIEAGSSTNILHFYDFNLSQGDIANFIMGFGVNKYVGLVDKQIVINGILNSFKNGTIGGDVMFVSPEGMLVGQSGILNVGSLQLVTPNQTSYDSVIAQGRRVSLSSINRLRSDSDTSSTEIYGKIFSSGAINLEDANKITLGMESDIVSGFNANGFAKTRTGDLSGIVNDEGIVDAQYMSGNSGNIKIVSKSIAAEDTFSRESLIQSTGNVTINTPSTSATQISLTSRVEAGGDVTIGNFNETSPTESTTTVNLYNTVNSKGNISVNGDTAYIGSDADLNASSPGGTIETNTRLRLTLNSDMTADSGIKINSIANFEQGANSSIRNLSTGNININSVNLNQNEGAVITNEGQGDIIIDSPGIVSLQKIDAQNGSIDISTDNLSLNNEISSTGDIDLTASSIEQTSDDFTALNSGNNITINTTSGNIGSASQSINLSAAGTVSLDATTAPEGSAAYIKGQGENDLNLAQGTNLVSLDATSENGIKISGNISANRDVNLTASTGITQESGTTVSSRVGDVNLTNTTSGDITTGNLTSRNESVNVTNEAADGSVTIGGVINASNGGVNISADNSITQSVPTPSINAGQDVNLTATKGDVGSDEQRIVVTTDGAVNVNAGQAANIEGQDTDIDLSKIHAGTDYNLAAKGEGSIILGEGPFHNEHGGIELETDKVLNITDDITAVGDITLISGNGITQSDGTRIESGLGDSQSGNIEITNTGEGGITITSATSNKGGITISNSDTATGDVSVGGIIANGGDISVTNSAESGSVLINNTISSDSNIEITSNKDITQSADIQGVAIDAQNNVSLTAAGTVGTQDKAIILNAGNVVNGAGVDIYLESPDADLTLGAIAAQNNLNLKTTGSSPNNITLTDAISGVNINIDATGSIYQETEDAAEKTITAGNSLNLTAQQGSIGDSSGDTLKTIGFSLGENGTLSANAQNGSVAINGIETDIDTASVNAGNNIDIITTTSGNITVSNEQNVTGHINLDSAENIALNKAISASENITVNAKGDLTQSADLTGTALTSQKDITITAANAGSEEKAVIVDAQGVVNVGNEENHAGNLYLEDNTGDFTIGQMFADENLSLKAQGNIIQADDSVVGITSSGTVTVESDTGSIGSENSSLKLNIAGDESSFNVVKSENVYVESLDSDLNTGNINAQNTVDIKTTGSGGVNLNGVITANDVTIAAVDSIIQSPELESIVIDAQGNLVLSSQQGNIGATGENGSSINFSSSALSANAQEGSVYLNGIETTINTNDIIARQDIDLTTTGSGDINVEDAITAEGHITLNAADELNLNGALTANDYIDIAANGGNIVLNSALSAGTDIGVTASGSITQADTFNDTVLNAGKDINLSAGADIGSEGKSILVSAQGVVNAEAGAADVPVPGSVYIRSPQQSLTLGKITASNNVNLAAAGSNSDVILTDKVTGGNVSIKADNNILQNLASEESDRSIEASGNLNLEAVNGNIGETDNAIDFSSEGSLSASAANGSVVLNGIDTDINTSSITAQKDIDLSTQNTGKITVSDNITTADGYIRLNSAESLELNKNLSAGRYVELSANGGVIQDSTTSITSGTNSSSSADDSYVSVSNAQGGNITLENIVSKGDVTVNNAALEEGSASGNITLGSITASDGAITVNNEIGNISHSGNGMLSSSGNIKFDAAGDVGSLQNSMLLASQGTVEANGNNVFLESSGQDLKIAGINSSKETSNGTVNLKTTGSGDIHFEGLVKGGNISVDAAQSVTQSVPLPKAIEASSGLTLKANSGSIGSTDNALRFSSAGNLEAQASEAVVLNGIDTDIITSAISAGTDIDLTTTIEQDDTKGNIIVNNTLNAERGYVTLDSAKGLNINNDISALYDVTLNAQNGDINLNSQITPAGALIMEANGNITQTGGKLLSTGDMFITSNGGNITLTDISSDGAGIDITANEVTGPEGGTVASGDITLGTLSAREDINITNNATGKDVTLNGNIDGTDGNSAGKLTIASKGDTTVNGSVYADGVDIDSENNIEINNNINANSGSVDFVTHDGDIIVNGEIEGAGITLNSALNIEVNKSIADSSGTVLLTTQNGDIDIAADVYGSNTAKIIANGNITQTGGTIEADGSGDSVNVISNGGNITLNGVDAYGYLTITANEISLDDGTVKSGDITLGGTISSGEETTITNKGAGKDVIINGSVVANGLDYSPYGLKITSKGDIVQNSSDASIKSNYNIILDAQGNIGSDGQYVKIDTPADKASVVEANGQNVYLQGNKLDIAGINKDSAEASGVVDIYAPDEVNISGLIKGGDVSIYGYHGISQSETLDLAVDAGNLSLSSGGNIGSASNALDIKVAEDGNVEAQSVNDIYLNSPQGNLSTGTITSTNGTVDINSSSSLNMNGLISGSNVNLTAVNDITQNKDIDKSIQVQNALNITSTNGSIGQAATDTEPANAIDFSAGSLSASAQNGSVVLNGVDTSIETNDVVAGGSIDISTTGAGSSITVTEALNSGGYVNLDSAAGLVLNGDITAVESVSLGAQTDILLNHIITAGTDINVDAAGNIIQDTASSNVVLNAGNNIALNAGLDIGQQNKAIALNADGNVSAEGQNIYLTSPNKNLTIASVTSTNNGNVNLSTTGSGNIHFDGLVKGGNININSAGGITQNTSLDKSIEASEDLILTANDGDIGEAQNGNIPANAIDFSAGSVEAHADRGSVVLNGVDSDINTGDITALNNIDLTTTNSGQITVASELSTETGYINLDSAEGLVLNENVTSKNSYVSLGSQNGDVILNAIVTAAQDINIDTNGDIIQQTTDTALNAGQDINIISAQNAGSSSNSLLVNAGNEVNANGQNLYLEDNTGDFVLGEINAQNYAQLTAEGNIKQSDTSQTSVTSGGNVSLISKNGNIGLSADEAVKTNVAGNVNAQAEKGSVYFNSDGNFNAGNITALNTAQMNSADNINLNGLIKANETNITAQNNITQSTENRSIESTGGNINLVSKQGNIGTPNGNAIGFSLTGSGVVNADASANGSVVLKGIDSDINTSTIKAKNDIDLTTTGSGNITVSDALNAGGYIKLNSSNALTLDKNLTAAENIDLIAGNGDITISSILDAGTDINLDASGSVTQTLNDTVLNAQDNINISAGQNIGSETNSILLNAGGTVLADGNNIYLTSPDADLTTGTITAQGIADINTTGSGSITADGSISADSANIQSAEDINVNQNITVQNGLNLNAQSGISQSGESTISSQNGDLNITANNGNLNLSGTVSNQNGAVSVVNESTGNAELNINRLSAGSNFNIRHEGNGMLNVNGTLTNNGNSSVVSNNTGANAGLSLKGAINNNRGTLNITSQGQKGMQISGAVNNDILSGTGSSHSDITIHNQNGALSITSSKIDNGQTNGSQNSISITNDGSGGLSINSDITNYGNFSVTNNSGEMNIDGSYDAQFGSKNTFTNGSDSDFVVNSEITNRGNELILNNTGAGSLVIGENALLTVYSVLDNGNIYTGTLNLKNSGTGGNIQINGKIAGLESSPIGHIIIENTATGNDSGIAFGEGASIDAQNNSVSVTNNGLAGITAADNVAISSSDEVLIQNTSSSDIVFGNNSNISGNNVIISSAGNNSGVSFGNNAVISSDNDLNISSHGGNGIEFGSGAEIGSNSLSLVNSGNTGGISFNDNAVLTVQNGIAIENTGAEGISFEDNASLSASNININNLNTSNSGVRFGNDVSLVSQGGLTVTNSGANGISFGERAGISSALDALISNSGAQGIIFGNSSVIKSQGKLDLINTGGNSIVFGNNSNFSSGSDMTVHNDGENGLIVDDGTVLASDTSLNIQNTGAADVTVNGTLKGQNISVENENSNLNIAHNNADGNIIANNEVTITLDKGNVINTSSNPENAGNKGISAGGNVKITASEGSIGLLDSTLNNIIQDGFVLDRNNSVHINSGGDVTAVAGGDVNITSDSSINFEELSAQDALVSTVNGAINADEVNTENLYLLAQGANGSINIQNLNNTQNLTSESTLDTVINSNAALNIDSMLSHKGSVNINSEGNTYINEIAAANDITVSVEDEKLTINNLGRVQRDTSVVPKTVNLTVKDAKRPVSGDNYRPGMSYEEINQVAPNSKLDIYNAYVQDKVTLKADTITAQVYDISDGAQKGDIRVDQNGNQATGFHNANKNGELLEFDIQGANYRQENTGSDPHNPYYTPDAGDKHALNVHLTIGDSVDDAQLGANFKKLYSDYAFIDTVVSDESLFSNITLESGIIGEKAIFRNNKFRVDVDNTSISQDYPINIHYDDEPDKIMNNKTSFNLKMFDTIEIDVKPEPPSPTPVIPVDPDYFEKNDPNKIIKVPNLNILTQEPDTKADENNKITDDTKAIPVNNISWVVRNDKKDIIGASEQIHDPIVKQLIGISQKGILVVADTNSDTGLKLNDIVHIHMKKGDASFNIDGKVSDINKNMVEIGFVNVDKLTSNILMFWCMEAKEESL